MWSRHDIEDLFEVRRATAQSLMKAIGGIQSVGGTHLIDRESLLEFLTRSIASDDLSATVQKSKVDAGPMPRSRKLTFALPAELRTVMAADLPSSIRFSPGQLLISGRDSVEVVELLYLLAQAMQNDLGSIQAMLDPVPDTTATDGDDLRMLLESLRSRREHF